MVGQSYAVQLGLRFKALRVHRECDRIYHEVDSRAAKEWVPGIRFDHYYPWLFADDFRLGSHLLRSVAVANVLLSDGVNGTLRALRSGGPVAADAKAPIHEALIERATQRLDNLLGGDAAFSRCHQQIMSEVRSAFATERQLMSGTLLLSDAEAEQHAAHREAYLKISIMALGHLSGRADLAARLSRAQERLSVALDLYRSFINWRQEVVQHPLNRVLNMVRAGGSNMQDQNRIGHMIYETELKERIFQLIMDNCRVACEYEYESRAFRQIIKWLMERIEQLRRDLQVLNSGATHLVH